MRLTAGIGRLGWSLGATLAAAGLLAAPAAAMSSRGPLSPRLTELAKPSVRLKSPAKQAAILSVAPGGPGSLLREGNRVLVDVRFDHGAAVSLDALRAAGARIVTVSRRYQTVTVAATPASLHDLADVARVQAVTEDLAPILYGSGDSPLTAVAGAQCEGGSVISEGVAQLHVKEARSNFNVNGSGVTVGVLSDSFDTATEAADGSGSPVATHAAEDERSGDLPGPANPCSGQKTPVDILEDYAPASQSEEPEATDEGRAMLQIVHDVAPGANLAFATAFKGEPSFAQNIERLAKPSSEGGAGAKVIADDATYFEEPFFQDGPIAAAVNKVTSDGVSYFSAAGNNNLFNASGHEIGSWEAPSFRDSGTCPAALLAHAEFGAEHCMNFNPGSGAPSDSFGITVEGGATLTVDLQWAEPWFGVKTDLDAFLLNSKGEPIEEEGVVVGNYGDNIQTQKPVEVFQWENKTGSTQEVRLAINRCSSTCDPAASSTATPRLKFALLENGGGVSETAYPVSSGGDTVGPTIFGHNGAASAITVGAVPFNNNEEPESYSSRGPVTHYFEPVNGATPAAALASPQTISKPDVVASDCVATTFFAFQEEGVWRFCGTSAAAPHAAGVAALELQADPTATVAQIRNAQTSTASPVGHFGPEAVGAGLLNADAAVESLLGVPVVTITKRPPSRTSDKTPTFSFTSSEEPASFTCSLDGASPQPCSSPYTVAAPLADGLHEFEVTATDPLGNVGHTADAFTVDSTPPAVTFTDQPASISNETIPTFSFTASEEPSTFTCSLDGASPQPCSSPYTVAAPLADGLHEFEVTATDPLGNVGHAFDFFTVDTTPPAVTFVDQPANISNETTPTFSFTSSEEPATFTCSLDGASPQPCSSLYTVAAPLADGLHEFEVTATDPLGNVGHAFNFFTVDTRRPSTFFVAHPRRVIRTHHKKARATFRFGSDESGATFVCAADHGLLHVCGPTFSRWFDLGSHLVVVETRVTARGVNGTPVVFHFKVKRVG